MNLTAMCSKCNTLLKEDDHFGIADEAREDFFAQYGQPMECPACHTHFTVQNGMEVEEIGDHVRPFREYDYAMTNDGHVFFALDLWPSPNNYTLVFRLENLAENQEWESMPIEDFTEQFASSDEDYVEPILDILSVCRSIAIVGEAHATMCSPVTGTIRLTTEEPKLHYRELCRRVFGFYEQGTPVRTDDMRFYRLIWKAMYRIYMRHMGRTRRAFQDVHDLAFLEQAREWAKEEYGNVLRLTPVKVRAIRAIIEHYALESAKGTAESVVEAL